MFILKIWNACPRRNPSLLNTWDLSSVTHIVFLLFHYSFLNCEFKWNETKEKKHDIFLVVKPLALNCNKTFQLCSIKIIPTKIDLSMIRNISTRKNLKDYRNENAERTRIFRTIIFYYTKMSNSVGLRQLIRLKLDLGFKITVEFSCRTQLRYLWNRSVTSTWIRYHNVQQRKT